MNDKPNNSLIDAKRTLHGVLESEKVKEQIARVLPEHITPERLIRVALTAANKAPNLLLCSPESVVQALLVCAQAGLEPDDRLAHLIPYHTKEGWKVQVIFGFKGLIALALRNGIDSVFADKVCEKDDFTAGVVSGNKEIRHLVDWKKDRGPAYAYYCVTKKGSTIDFEVMTLAEVKSIQARSKAGGNGPWVTDFDEMAKKTVVRRMSKRWDLIAEIRDAVCADDDVPEPIEVTAHSRPIFATPKTIDPPTANGPAAEYIPSPSEFPPSDLSAEDAARIVQEEMGGEK